MIKRIGLKNLYIFFITYTITFYITEKASRNREMNQQLSKRMQDRMDYENENMFPERKHGLY